MQEFDDFYVRGVSHGFAFFFFFNVLQDLEDRDLESGDMEVKIFLNNAWLQHKHR